MELLEVLGDDLKYCMMDCGAQFVVMAGTTMRPKWLAGKLLLFLEDNRWNWQDQYNIIGCLDLKMPFVGFVLLVALILLLQYGWTISPVQDQRPLWINATLLAGEDTTVPIIKMLALCALGVRTGYMHEYILNSRRTNYNTHSSL